ncbi:MAG: FHA domain-containing protein [Firmicutes bacterium]|nr:FHA domain-containing protein [Bacillota bacterium]
MYDIIAMLVRYALTFVIYLFIYRIVKLIYSDIKTMTIWEEAKDEKPHLLLMSSMDKVGANTVVEIFPLGNQLSVIGRALDCEIVIADPHISSKHLQIEKTIHGYSAQDLGSVNGTYINGVRLLNPILLKSGDEITIGITHLVFSEGEHRHG